MLPWHDDGSLSQAIAAVADRSSPKRRPGDYQAGSVPMTKHVYDQYLKLFA
jgi:hypothetical protein